MFNKERFSNIENETRMYLTRLNEIHVEIRSDSLNADLHLKEGQAMHEYNMLNKARMTFLKQKVKDDSLKGGDENTTYFHACIRKRRTQNQD